MGSTTPAKLRDLDGKPHPKMIAKGENELDIELPDGFLMTEYLGMQTFGAANGVFITAVEALGKSAEKHGTFAAAMFAELKPRDAVEAMLIAQMTATHVAMTNITSRASYQSSSEIHERLERSMTRLSRTYIAQMEALKKYRSKAQQTVRVERVTVNEGGQAIVGDVSHKSG